MAGGEEERVAGALTLEPEGPMLQLSGMLTPAWTEGAPNPEHGTTSISRSPATDNEYLTVHGYADGTPVTLIDSFTTHRRYSFMDPEVGEHQLGATYAVIGAHVPGNDALYTAVRFRTRHLDEWASLPGSSTGGRPSQSPTNRSTCHRCSCTTKADWICNKSSP